MRRNLRTVAAAAALVVVGVLAGPMLYAHAAADAQDGGMMGGMMQEGGPMMGGGGMMGGMERMDRMMATCTEMMQAHMRDHGAPRPNEQWRAPEGGEAPELPGEQRPPSTGSRG